MRALFLSASLAVCTLAGTAAGQSYHAVELPLLPGGTFASAWAINESGRIVGEGNCCGLAYPQAIVWLNDGPFDVGGTGFSVSISTDINESGLVVGFTDEFGAFVLEPAEPDALSPEALLFSRAWAVNNSNIIVGHQSDRAFVWQGGVSMLLPDLGIPSSRAHDINDAGVIVGWAAEPDNDTVAVRWMDGEIEVIVDSDYDAKAYAINESGQIVGEMSPPSGIGEMSMSYAFLWDGGRVVQLPALPGFRSSAMAINAHGDIVGHSAPVTVGRHAVIWRNGEIHDLNNLIVSGALDLVLEIAHDINDAGQIVGEAEDGRAFRLDPIPDTPGDLTGDGIVNGIDLGILLANWGDCGGPDCAADLTGDGVVNGLDLGVLLASWTL